MGGSAVKAAATGSALDPIDAGAGMSMYGAQQLQQGKLGLPGTAGPMLGGMFGQRGGISGTGFAPPQLANVQQAVTPGQIAQGNQGVQNALGSQQQLLQALQGQGGIANQNAVFNQGQALANQLQGANPVAAQQALMNQYGNIAAGRGPSPGQAMLNQATGQNVANQAALMAGQRGAGANAGLMARQAAQQGAATQQQAVGQGAQMQAQNQLAAMQAMSGMAGQQLGALQGQQQALAGQAAGQVGNQMGATTALNQAQQNAQQQQLNALGQQNQANIAAQGNVNAGNVGLAQTTMQGQQGMVGGLLNAVGSGAGMMAGAQGGEVVKMADGGDPAQAAAPAAAAATPASIAPPAAPTVAAPIPSTPHQSSFGRFMANMNQSSMPSSMSYAANPGEQQMLQGGSNLGKGIASMAKKKPGAASAPDETSPAYVAKGGLAKGGGSVNAKKDGQKAEKHGDNYSNDKIPAMLSEGEIVLPRSVTKSKDPVAASAKFVQALMANKRKSA